MRSPPSSPLDGRDYGGMGRYGTWRTIAHLSLLPWIVVGLPKDATLPAFTAETLRTEATNLKHGLFHPLSIPGP